MEVWCELALQKHPIALLATSRLAISSRKQSRTIEVACLSTPRSYHQHEVLSSKVHQAACPHTGTKALGRSSMHL